MTEQRDEATRAEQVVDEGHGADPLLAAIDSPRELERCYRQDPALFREQLPRLIEQAPDSLLLQGWRERLFFDEGDEAPEGSVEARSPSGVGAAAVAHGAFTPISLWSLTLLGLLAGTLNKLPFWFDELPILPDGAELYLWHHAFLLTAAPLLYLLFSRRAGGLDHSRAGSWFAHHRGGMIMTAFAALWLYLTLFSLVTSGAREPRGDIEIMALLHLPALLWLLLGIAFDRRFLSDSPTRLAFLHFSAEVMVFTTLVLLGGVLLTLITLGLFEMLDLRLTEWYLSNVVVYGLCAAPVVAAYLVDRSGQRRLAPMLASLFTPLFFITLTLFLVTAAIQAKDPFHQRDVLIFFNGLLLAMLAITILSLAERRADSSRWGDAVRLGLVLVTLLLNIVSLAALLYRSWNEGATPNRVAATGLNLITLIHFLAIARQLVELVRRRVKVRAVEYWITSVLPAYPAWAIYVVFLQPVLFGTYQHL